MLINMLPAEMLLILSESSDHLYFLFDIGKKQFTYFNPAFNEFFDWDAEEASPATLLQYVHPEDKDYLLLKVSECFSGKNVKSIECRFIRERNQRWLRITAYYQQRTDGIYLTGFAEDITTYKAQTQIINEHNNKNNSILNILAHDLAGPIGTIQNLSTLLGEETSRYKNQKIDEYIRMVAKVSKSSIDLIRNFVNQEFLESANVKLLKRRVNIVERISSATQEYLNMQIELNIKFNCRANKDVIYVEIDEDKFLQVISNLISNALKFTPDGGTISVNIEDRETAIMITVMDTGIGIPEKYHETLFNKFSDARRNGLKGEYSTGLGMYIIKTIVDWHHGHIWFKSEENNGTTFFIELPK